MLWNDMFLCQIPHIDAQHMALFDHIEKLGNMHGDVSRIPKTLEFLENYTCEHFSDEESLHKQLRYPNALEHSRQHGAFVQQIQKVRKEYDASGHNLATMMDMNHAIVDWLKQHILQSDKQFVQFFHSRSEEERSALRLPHRPWIPESSQVFYQKATGTSVKPDAVPAGAKKTATVMKTGSWTDAMLCGIPLIDEQHQELFRQIDILKDRGNKDRVPGVLRFLTDYVVKHFNDEESLHLKSRYPQAQGHRKLHENFVKTFLELKAKYENSTGDFSTLMEVNKVIFDWLKEHVLKVDKQFAKYYLELPENAG